MATFLGQTDNEHLLAFHLLHHLFFTELQNIPNQYRTCCSESVADPFGPLPGWHDHCGCFLSSWAWGALPRCQATYQDAKNGTDFKKLVM